MMINQLNLLKTLQIMSKTDKISLSEKIKKSKIFSDKVKNNSNGVLDEIERIHSRIDKEMLKEKKNEIDKEILDLKRNIGFI